MAPTSPAGALGPHAGAVRDLLVDVVRTRHDLAAEAHHVSKTRYGNGFGAQWRDLLDDVHEALTGHGFPSHKLSPGGYKVGVVNGCLLYVWRVSDAPDAVKHFASSPTRLNCFDALPPEQMLWEGDFPDAEASELAPEPAETATLVAAVREKMPVVLVLVRSTPRQLQAIQWAVAGLDGTGLVELHGLESIWEPEAASVDVASDVEPFDSGAPVVPVVEVVAQEGPSDA